MKVLGGLRKSAARGEIRELLVQTALQELQSEGIETEFVSLAGRQILPCTACGDCSHVERPMCTLGNTGFEGMIERFMEADGILVGSPVYFGSATPETMALLDRVGLVSLRNGRFLRRKVGAAIAVARRAGQNFTFAQLNYFFLINEMIIPGSTYWNIAFGREKGEAAKDEEGMQTIKNLAHNMAFLLQQAPRLTHGSPSRKTLTDYHGDRHQPGADYDAGREPRLFLDCRCLTTAAFRGAWSTFSPCSYLPPC